VLFLTSQDRLRLSFNRLVRFREIYPHLPKNFYILKNSLIFDVDQKEIASLICQTNLLLQSAAIVFGTFFLEIHCRQSICFIASLQLQAANYTASKNMVAAIATSTATEENVRTEFHNLDRMQIIPWNLVAPRIESNEAELKLYLNEQKIPFHWASNGEWGIEESDATLLVQAYYQAKASAEIQAMRFPSSPEPQQSEDVTSKPKNPKSKNQKNSAIKLIGEYKPVKNLLDSVRRYLEAFAPGDTLAQNKALDEIIAGGMRGKKHLKLALQAYKEGEVPVEAELSAAFVRLRDRRIKEATKIAETEASEELAQN
jgi:hypothetical protein